MLKKTIVFSSVMGFSAMAAEPSLYKYTDENGVTHYSQSKLDDRYEPVASAPVTVVPSVEVKKRPSRTSDTDEASEEVTFQEMVDAVKLTKPQPEENIWGTGLKLTASMQVDPLLLETHDVQYVIDGKSMPANRKATQTFENIYRGEHNIYGQLVMKGSSRITKKTKKITFYMHQASKK